jgi:predicted PurR-regulated permease PerM
VSVPVTPLAGENVQRISLVIVAVVAFVAAAWVASALWAGLLVGVLLAFAIEPAYRRFLVLMPRRRALAAGLATSLATLIGLGIVVGLATVVARELSDALPRVTTDLAKLTPESVLGKTALKMLEGIGVTAEVLAQHVSSYATRATALASGVLSAVVGAAFHWGIGTFMAVVTAFYTLKERRPIERRLEQILPLNPQTTRDLAREFRLVGRGTFIGSALAALVQGVLATVGFAIVGIQQSVLLGMLTAVASFVPVVGTLVVWVPVGIILILTGRPAAGIFELAWGVFITTGLVDYVLRPVLVGKESRSHPLLFLIGLIGGIEIFGGIGVLAGPLIMMFFASVLRIYRRDVVDPIRRSAPRRVPTTGGMRSLQPTTVRDTVRDTEPVAPPVSARVREDTLPSGSELRSTRGGAHGKP